VFRTVKYTDPYEWLRYNPNRNKERIESTVLYGKAPVSFVTWKRCARESYRKMAPGCR